MSLVYGSEKPMITLLFVAYYLCFKYTTKKSFTKHVLVKLTYV